MFINMQLYFEECEARECGTGKYIINITSMQVGEAGVVECGIFSWHTFCLVVQFKLKEMF